MVQAPSLQMAWLGYQGLPGFLSHLDLKAEAPMGCLHMRPNPDGTDLQGTNLFPAFHGIASGNRREKKKVGSEGMPNIHKE